MESAQQGTSAPAAESAGSEHPQDAQDGGSEGYETEAGEGEVDAEPWRKVKHRVKVDGEELELDYEELKRGYGLQKSLTQRQQKLVEEKKAIQAEKQALQDFFAEVQKRPQMLFEIAEKLGLDPREVADSYSYEKLKWDKMSEEERQAAIRDQKLAEYEAADKARREAEEAEKLSRVEREAAESIDSDVATVLKSCGLKPKARVVARIAELYQARINATERRPTAEELSQIARDVKRWYAQDVLELFSEDVDLDELEREGFLPEHLVKRVSQHYARKLKPMPSIGTSHVASSPPRSKGREKVGVDTWLKKLGK